MENVDSVAGVGDTAPVAGVMELVDVPDSKSGVLTGVRVRVPPPAPPETRVRAPNDADHETKTKPR
jgi:hypothetical protein